LILCRGWSAVGVRIVVQGGLSGPNQFNGEAYLRKIELRRRIWNDYEADLSAEVEPPLGRNRPRDLPADDSVPRNGTCVVGPEVADGAGRLMAQQDGSRPSSGPAATTEFFNTKVARAHCLDWRPVRHLCLPCGRCEEGDGALPGHEELCHGG